MLVEKNDWVHYFPSYEVITGAYTRGRYFAEDLRNVTEEGVSHVMRLFLSHAAGIVRPVPASTPAPAPAPAARSPEPAVAASVAAPAAVPSDSDADARQAAHASRAAAFVQVECDEEGLDRDEP
jgi:hypothetical protein